MGTEITVYKGNQAIARAVVEDLDGDNQLNPVEAARTVFKRIDTGQVVRIDELVRDLGATHWASVVGGITGRRKPISFFVDMFKEHERFRGVTITIDLPEIKKRVNKLPKKDRPSHKLYPLVKAGQSEFDITVRKVDENYREISGPEALEIKKAGEEQIDSEILEALKHLNTTDIKPTVKHGFVEEPFSETLKRAEAAEEKEEESPSDSGEISLADASLDKTYPQVKNFKSRLKWLIEFLEMLMMLVLGDSERIGALFDFDGFKKSLRATLFGVNMEPFRRKKAEENEKLEKEIEKKYAKKTTDPAEARKVEAEIRKMERIIKINNETEQLVNNIIKEQLDNAEATRSMASSVQQMTSGGRLHRSRFGS